MQKINFKNKPSTDTPVNATNLNLMQDYIEAAINSIYPIGSIYMSVNNTNPSTLFGGTWEQIEDRFLLGAGDTYTAGSTGGNMPSLIGDLGLTAESYGGINTGGDYSKRIVGTRAGIENDESYMKTLNNFGYDGLPPYLTVYMWKRTA